MIATSTAMPKEASTDTAMREPSEMLGLEKPTTENGEPTTATPNIFTSNWKLLDVGTSYSTVYVPSRKSVTEYFRGELKEPGG